MEQVKPHLHSVHDSESRERQAQGALVEEQRQQVQDAVDHKLDMARVLENPELTPQYDAVSIDDPQAWIGESLAPAKFEARLRRIFPNVVFMTGLDGRFKSILRVLPDGGLEPTGVCFQNMPFLPEFSIMNRVIEDVPDPTYDGGCSRADLPKHEFNSVLQCWDVDTSRPRPGYKRIERADTERYRGWRVVLLRLCQEGYLKLGDVVREFGAVDRLGWAKHTGALNVKSPY